jgi:hypothetical protein
MTQNIENLYPYVQSSIKLYCSTAPFSLNLVISNFHKKVKLFVSMYPSVCGNG